MKRLVISAALVAAVLGVTILSATGSAKPPPTERTFTLIERDREGQFRFVNLPPRGGVPPSHGGRLSAGDEFALHQPVRNGKGVRVGSLDALCVATRGGKHFGKAQFACHGGLQMKRGTIDLEALIPPGSGPKIGVTGGTGAFEGVSGSIKSVSHRNRSVDTVHLLLP